MTTLIIEDSLRDQLRLLLEESADGLVLNKILECNPAYTVLLKNIKKILQGNKYLILKGYPSLTKLGLEALVRSFGTYYGCVEHTGIKVECEYTGCSASSIDLHNDDAIDMETQPHFGFIQVIKEDPIYAVENGVVLIRDVVRKLKYERPELFEKLKNTAVPMCSKGINFEDRHKDSIFVKSPILYKFDSEYRVRFDLGRIQFFYQNSKTVQSYDEAKMVYDFMELANSVKRIFFLSKGDVLIHDNLVCMHDRSECSITVDSQGNISSREILVSFSR